MLCPQGGTYYRLNKYINIQQIPAGFPASPIHLSPTPRPPYFPRTCPVIVSVLERFSSSLVVLWRGEVSMVMFYLHLLPCVVQFVFLKICFTYILCIITLIIKITIYVFYSILHSTLTLPHLFNSTPDLIVDPRHTLFYSCKVVTL